MFLCSKSKQLKKQFFKVNFPQFFHLNTWNAVLTHLDSLFDKGQEKHCSSKFQTKNKISLEKNGFPQNIPLDARMAFVRTLKEFSRKNSYFFGSNPNKFETMWKVSSIFSLKIFQGYVGYSSDNSVEFFRQRKIKSSLRIFNKVVIYFVFEKGFSLIYSPEHLFQFRQLRRKISPLSHELHHSSEKP